MFNTYYQQETLDIYLNNIQDKMDEAISIDSEFLDLLEEVSTANRNISQLEGVIPGAQRLNETIETMQGLNVSGPLRTIIEQTIGQEISENIVNDSSQFYTIPVPAPSHHSQVVDFPILTHEIEIVNQPQRNEYKFRHESEKPQANEIKAMKAIQNASNWPQIQVTNPPSCPADVWIQLVENKSPVNGQDNPSPSPNGLFHKKKGEWAAPYGIIIHDNGEKDGKGIVKFISIILLLTFNYFFKLRT
jgi:hypothetical protein